MTLNANTILITGGASGIGLELARRLAADNKVIICDPHQGEVQKAAGSIPGVYGFSCDIAIEKELLRMVKSLSYNFVDLDVILHADLRPDLDGFVTTELIGMFVPLLSVQPEATIVNLADQRAKNEMSLAINEFLQDTSITTFAIQLLFDAADLSPAGCITIAKQILSQLEENSFHTSLAIPYDN